MLSDHAALLFGVIATFVALFVLREVARLLRLILEVLDVIRLEIGSMTTDVDKLRQRYAPFEANRRSEGQKDSPASEALG
jgi:hypothetical protein